MTIKSKLGLKSLNESFGLVGVGSEQITNLRRLRVLTTLLVLGLSGGAVRAQTYAENVKLTGADGAAGDLFGYSAAVSGDTMVIGSRNDDGFRGSAYVFVRSAGIWTQQAKLTASDGAAGDEFGISTSISGDTVVVGARIDDIGPNIDQGSAYVFVKPGGGWSNMTQTAKVTVSDGAADDYFGRSVAVSGDTVVVGAPGDDVGPNPNQGAAYVFVKPGIDWVDMTQSAKLIASDGDENDYFGDAVAVSGVTVVVGDNNDDIGANSNQGSAYVFVKTGVSWSDMTQTAKLTASDGADGDEVGIAVSISGDTVVVGANLDDIGPNADQGSAYVFVMPGGGWADATQTAKLTASDGAAADWLGFSVAVSGDIVVVGARTDDIGANLDQGSANVFAKPGGGWSNMTQTAKLTASDGAADDWLGFSVGLSGDYVVVGAALDNIGPNADQGSAYVFGPFRVYVDGYAEGANDGMNWIDAYLRLQDALAYASMHPEISEIWVADGTYRPDLGIEVTPGDRTASFQLLNGVALYGGFTGGETALDQRNVLAHVAILSGDLLGDDGPGAFENNGENSYHVVTGDGTDDTAVLDGFTITAGNANAGAGNVNGGGAGITMSEGSATFSNCTISENNAAGRGAGAFVESTLGGGADTPTFRSCSFVGNTAGAFMGEGGGAIWAGTSGGPITTSLIRCYVAQNSAGGNGGAIVVKRESAGSSVLRAINSYFFGNMSSNRGGAIYVDSGGGGISPITNCVFISNTASAGDAGGAIRHWNGSLTLTNCTLANNSTTNTGGGIYTGGGTLAVENSILWGNSDSGGTDESAQLHVFAGSPTVDYSIVQGGWSGAGASNLSSDPLFFNTANGDYRVFANSPAVDSGDNAAVPADVADLDDDADTLEPTPLAFGQIGRFEDNPFVSDAGNGTAPIVDRGAFEVRGFNILYVDANGPGSGDWAFAYGKLQDALTESKASASAQIWVAEGTYYPDEGVGITPGDRAATFQLMSGVELYGGFAGFENDVSERNIEANPTILSGDLNANDIAVPCTQDSQCGAFGSRCLDGTCIIRNNNAENSYHVVKGSGADSTAVLDGFTITAGNANSIEPDNNGGGIYNFNNGSPTMNNCTLTANSASSRGGGMYNYLNASPRVTGCAFIGNSATNNAGGMYNESGTPNVNDCTFSNNTSSIGGGMMNDGNVTVSKCEFSGNKASQGGGMANSTASSTTVTNCTFHGNSATLTGGGMLNVNVTLSIVTNCTFSGNTAIVGGGMENGTSSPTVTNCTFSRNSATDRGGGINNASSSPVVINSILWGNSDPGGMDESAQINTESGSPTVNYSLVQGGWSGAGSNNVSADPLFIDADGEDNVVGTSDDNLRPLPGSPAIDAADTPALPADAGDLDGDANTAEQVPFDLVGNPRRIDDPDVDDTGAGSAPIVDMGAYEFQANVLFVDSSATGNDDGSSWAHAYTELQTALTIAGIIDSGITEIWVADGTYKPDQGGKETPGDRNAFFHLSNKIALYGGFAGGETTLSHRDPVVNVTILSGDLGGDDTPVACTQKSPDCNSFGRLCVNGLCIIPDNNDENSYHVVYGSGTDETAILDGFTIRGGNANSGASFGYGGGIYMANGSPIVANCIVIGNSANSSGGGLASNNGADVSIRNCQFTKNASNGPGGGIFIDGGNPRISDSLFEKNSTDGPGGGVYATSSGLNLTRCTFHANAANGGGGGLSIAGATGWITNCGFFGNSSSCGGGAFSDSSSDSTYMNCVFSGNSSIQQGGGMCNASATSTTIVNATFSGNLAAWEGGGLYNYSANPAMSNCVFWGNVSDTDGDQGGPYYDSAAQIDSSGGTPLVSYSIVQGGWSGTGSNNEDVDPFFVDADGSDNVAGTADDDLRLGAGSPAIDAANTPALPLDTNDADGDGNMTERYPFDLAGKPRILDDPETVDTGVPGSPVVDMGAYEYFGDCNGNGIPDQCDLSCGSEGGLCDVPGCGQSSDCDPGKGENNGIPDECDIAGCGGNPDCDDCNLNGVPDRCDIASAGSLDVNPMDGIPDECSQFDPGCIADNDWSCFNNWNIPGEVYPDNAGPATYSVTLDEMDDVFLDVDVTIDTLRIIDDAVLNVTQTGAQGDLTIVESGGLLLESKLYAGPGRVIDVSNGLVRVQGNGFYGAPPALLRGDETHQSRDRKGAVAASNYELQMTNYEIGNRQSAIGNPSAIDNSAPQALGGPVCGNGTCEEGETSCTCPTESTCGACLAPHNLTLSNCAPCSPGMCDGDSSCDIILTGTMALSASGSIMMDGLSSATGEPVCPCCPCTIENTMACGGGFLRGAILPPPKFRAGLSTNSDIAGDLSLNGTVDLYYGSNNNLNLAGNFDNRLTTPSCFDWSTSGMTLVGLSSREFEAAGRDLGNSLSGFYYGSDTNFSLGELEVAANRSVTLVNRRNNLVGAGACQEALYVHHLILRANATLTLSNARIYYETLTQESGAAIVPQGCGQHAEVAPCPDAEACGDGNACTVDACNAGTCENVPIASLAYGDTAYTGEGSVVDVDDILCVLDAFAGIFNNCPVERADLTPCNIAACTTDDDCAALGAPCVQGRCHLLDVDDILAVLDAFVGIPGCPDPCP